jgi:hypothetical protein
MWETLAQKLIIALASLAVLLAAQLGILQEQQEPELQLGGHVITTVQEVHALERDYFVKNGKYLQIRCDGTLPTYETGTVLEKLGADITGFCVDVYRMPDENEQPFGEWGYTVRWHDEDGYHGEGVGPEKARKDFFVPKAPPYVDLGTSTPISSISFPDLTFKLPDWKSWIKTAHAAFTSNTHTGDFDKTNSDSFEVANPAGGELDVVAGGDLTLSAWINLASSPNTGEFYIVIGKYKNTGGDNDSRSYILALLDQADVEKLYFLTNDGSTETALIVAKTLSTGTWINYAVVFDNSEDEVKFYLDGVQEGITHTHTRDIHNGTSAFSIGALESPSAIQDFDGFIDDVRMWDRELSPTEISDLFNDPCNFDNGASIGGHWLLDNNGTDEINSNTVLAQNGASFQSADLPYACAAAGGNFLLGAGF